MVDMLKAVLGFEDKASPGINAVRGNLAKLKDDTGKLGAVGSLATSSIQNLAGALSVGAVIAYGKSVIDAADNMNDLATRTGIAVGEIAKYKLAADQNGSSIEAVAKGIKSLSGFMVENRAAMQAAGITATDTDGAFRQLADLFKGMPDPIERSALATKLFGKAGTELLPMLLQGSQGLADSAEKAKRYADALEKLAPKADEFNDHVSELKLNLTAISMNTFAPMIDGLIGLTKWLNDAAKGGKDLNQALEFLKERERSGIDATQGLLSSTPFPTAAAGTGRDGRRMAFPGMSLVGAMASRYARGITPFSSSIDAVFGDSSAARTSGGAIGGISRAAGGIGVDTADTIMNRLASNTLLNPEGKTPHKDPKPDRKISDYEQLIRLIGEKVEMERAEMLSGGKLLEADKQRAMLVADLASGKRKMTDAERDDALARLAGLEAIERQNAQIAEQIRLRDEEAKRLEEISRWHGKEIDEVEERLTKLRDENDAFGQTSAALSLLSAQRYEDAAAAMEQAAASDFERDASAATVAMYREKARVLRAISAEQARADANTAAKQAAEDARREWERTADTIERSLTDALMRGFESGKGFGENLRDTLENLFSTMILRPVIQAAVQPIAGSITNALGLTGGPGSAVSAGTNLLGGGGSMYNAFATSAAGESLGLSTSFIANAELGTAAVSGSTLTAAGSAIGTALPYIGAALAVGSLLMEDDGPAQRRGNFRSGLGLSTGVGPGESNNAIDMTQWFDGSSMNASLNQFQQEIAAREKRLIANLGLSSSQINAVDRALYGIGDRRYDFGMEGTNWRDSSADEQIAADRLQTISETLGISIAELTAAMSESAESMASKTAKLKAQQGADLLGAMGETLRSLDAVTGARSGVLAAIAGVRGEGGFDARREALRNLIDGSGDLQAQLGYAAELKSLIVDRYSTEREAIEANRAAARDAAEAQRQALIGVGDYARSLLASDLSPGTAADRLGASGAEFRRLLAAAQGGDMAAIGNLSGAAGGYLQQARGYYASGAEYAAIFGTVQGSLAALGISADSVAVRGDWEAQLAGLQQDTVDQLTDIAELTDGWTTTLETTLVEQTTQFEALGVSLADVAANTRDLDARIATLLDAALAVRFDKLAAAVEKSAALTARAVTNAVAVTVRN